jgi:hypothetical protein
MALVCYRIVEANPPTLRDFMSYAALGEPRPVSLPWQDPDPWAGVSVYDTERQARRLAERKPSLGSFIATLEIRERSSITWDGPGRRGHYNLYGDPAVLRSCVVDVKPV